MPPFSRLDLRSTSRLIFGLLAAVCVSVLFVAWYAQYGPDKQQPCPYCILQRYMFMFVGVIAFTASLHGPHRLGVRVYGILASIPAVAGLCTAWWLVNKGASMKSCAIDPVGEFVNGLPSANWWPEYLFATGGCGDVYPPLLGLHIPVWSLIVFAAMVLVLAILIAWSFAHTKEKHN